MNLLIMILSCYLLLLLSYCFVYQIWCSVYCVPKTKDSTFVAVFDPSSKRKVMQYSELDSRVSIILPVENTVRIYSHKSH